LERKALTTEQITHEVEWLLRNGHKRILLVAGEAPPTGKKLVDYYVEAIRTIYAANVKGHKIKRVNINCAPLTIAEFKQLKDAGIGTFQIFQETYHEETYRKYHTRGPKSDPDNRLSAIDNAFAAGIDDVGIGALYGLYDYRFETLALLMHVEAMEGLHNVGPHTISVPRIEPALGSQLSEHVPYPLTDEQFKKVVAVLRLSVPYTGIILSTRESAAMRDELFNLGISQVSAGSKTSPGGYAEAGDNDAQFSLSDERSLDQVIQSLLAGEFIPSFCAACYRSERTGEKFMNLAKPGTIKGCCSMNALITLKEYLDDFASPEVRKKGYAAIATAKQQLPPAEVERLDKFFADIDRGIRDAFV
jgi:2-iminoacetate synthase